MIAISRFSRDKNKNKNTPLQNQQPKIDNVNNLNINNLTLLAGPIFSGKTSPMLKLLSRMPDRDIYIITKSPPEHYSKIKIKEITGEIKPLNEYDKATIVSDGILCSSYSRDIDQFFIRGRHNNLGIYYLSQSNFELPKRTIRNNSNKITLFYQTLKDIENTHGDVAGYDMSYDEFKEICRKAWEEDYNCLSIDRFKMRDQER